MPRNYNTCTNKRAQKRKMRNDRNYGNIGMKSRSHTFHHMWHKLNRSRQKWHVSCEPMWAMLDVVQDKGKNFKKPKDRQSHYYQSDESVRTCWCRILHRISLQRLVKFAKGERGKKEERFRAQDGSNHQKWRFWWTNLPLLYVLRPHLVSKRFQKILFI